MKSFFLPLLLFSASTCFAQSYTAVMDSPIKLGGEKVRAYRALSDTAGKPNATLFTGTAVNVVGRISNRWAIVKKPGSEYVVPIADLSAANQLVVANATAFREIVTDPATGKIIYSEVVQTPDANQAELYTRAKLWFADTFKSAKDVVQAESRESGVIQGTGWQSVYTQSIFTAVEEKLWYTVKIAVKDGRYKYDITEFRFQSNPSTYNLNPSPAPAEGLVLGVGQPGLTSKLKKAYSHSLSMAEVGIEAGLKQGMAKPATGTSAGKSDW